MFNEIQLYRNIRVNEIMKIIRLKALLIKPLHCRELMHMYTFCMFKLMRIFLYAILNPPSPPTSDCLDEQDRLVIYTIYEYALEILTCD